MINNSQKINEVKRQVESTTKEQLQKAMELTNMNEKGETRMEELDKSEADEMFEKMGYKKVVDNSDCCIYDLEEEFRIKFNKKNDMQLPNVELREKAVIENMTYDIYLRLDEIQAIYKKSEELRMDIEINNEIEQRFINYLVEREMSEGTIEQYKCCLKSYKFEVGSKLNKEKFIEYKKKLLQKRKPKTVSIRIVGINQFVKFYAEYTKNKNYEDIIIKNVKLQNKQFINNVITVDEFKRMYEYAKNEGDIKYYFIIKFLGYTGARISELIRIEVKHIKKGYAELYSKGGKIRRIYIPENLKQEMLQWLNVNNVEEGYVFKNKYGNQITARGVSGELKKYAEKTNINKEKVYPHSFRHMFAINFLQNNNKDITLLADLLGHSNLSTTQIYLRRTEEEQIKIINNIDW